MIITWHLHDDGIHYAMLNDVLEIGHVEHANLGERHHFWSLNTHEWVANRKHFQGICSTKESAKKSLEQKFRYILTLNDNPIMFIDTHDN